MWTRTSASVNYIGMNRFYHLLIGFYYVKSHQGSDQISHAK